MKSTKLLRLFVISWVLTGLGGLASAKSKACDKVPTGVEAEDYFLNFVTENMPDSELNGFDAQIRVHRVKPVYANGKCPGPANHAAVLIHGRSLAGAPTFDLVHPDQASIQEALARAGIDTFAPDLLGYGYSSRLSLDEPCNASYPAYAANGTCAFGDRCDRSPNPAVSQLDQQRTQLRVNPLQPLLAELGTETCEHSSKIHFANHDNWARDITQVIEDAIVRAQPRGNKVVLIGYSLGGPRIARALYLLGDRAEHLIRRVVLWSSVFNQVYTVPGGPPSPPTFQPTEEEALDPLQIPTFPLALGGFGGINGVRGTPAQVRFCGGNPTVAIPDPSRLPPGTSSLLRQQHRDLEDPTKDPRYPNGEWQDLLGLDWGGTIFGSPTGLNRMPTFTSYGWNPEVAHTFTLPTLILHGLNDSIVPIENSNNIFNELTSVTNKVLVQVDCASHQMQMEVCGNDGDGDGVACEEGERCCTAEPGTIYGSDGGTWGGPNSTVATALIEWINHGTFEEAECGHFVVAANGVPSEVATPNCPPPDTEN